MLGKMAHEGNSRQIQGLKGLLSYFTERAITEVKGCL